MYLSYRNISSIVATLTMVDDFEAGQVRSSGELWSEICSSLPEAQNGISADSNPDFSDSFQPGTVPCNNQTHEESLCPSGAKWEPMEDSEMYIASLENRLKRLKGQSSDVTSRDMLRSLSQAKKECWDRFLHDAQTSELFQGGDLDESALEHFKRWLVPEKVAISAEELEFLLRPTQNQTHGEGTAEAQPTEEKEEEDDDSPCPEK